MNISSLKFGNCEYCLHRHQLLVTMMKLRRAIDGNAPNGLIWTIHGSGYRLAAGVHVATTG